MKLDAKLQEWVDARERQVLSIEARAKRQAAKRARKKAEKAERRATETPDGAPQAPRARKRE